jgi:signal peptidase II
MWRGPVVSEKALGRSNLIWVVLLILSVVGLDQLTKAFVVIWLDEGEIWPIIHGAFNMTLTYNKGAAFGFLASIHDDTVRVTLLWSATAVAVAAVIFMFLYEYGKDKLGQGALALVLGGAAGNMIDRLVIGKVVDFLDFYLGNYHWPAFNVADSAICVGVAILLLHKSKVKNEIIKVDHEES